jgi:hypothetical protein
MGSREGEFACVVLPIAIVSAALKQLPCVGGTRHSAIPTHLLGGRAAPETRQFARHRMRSGDGGVVQLYLHTNTRWLAGVQKLREDPGGGSL